MPKASAKRSSISDEQIGTYQTKSVASLRKAQQFAIEQDLTALKGDGASDDEIKNAINIEAIRVQAANQIRSINEQLKQLNALGDSPETLMYLGRNIPELASQGLPQTLDSIDTQLALLRAKFTDNDDSIRRLLEKRRLLIEVFKRQTYGYLYAQRTAAEARLAAAERPKGILIRYRELLRTAARDEATLTKLEAERQVFALEQARQTDPWELISTPTLLDKPVAPRKGRIMALGLLAGLVLGSGAALVVDRRTGLVFSTDELQSLLPCPLLKHLPALAPTAWSDAADLLASGPLAASVGPGPIALIPVGAVPADQLQAFSAELRRALAGRELLVSTDLRQTNRTDRVSDRNKTRRKAINTWDRNRPNWVDNNWAYNRPWRYGWYGGSTWNNWGWWPGRAAAWGVGTLATFAVIDSLVDSAVSSQTSYIVVPDSDYSLYYSSVQANGDVVSFQADDGSSTLSYQADCRAGTLNGAPPQNADEAQLLNAACQVAFGQ